MALKRLGLTDLMSPIIQKIEAGTGRRCYDVVEDDAPSPFYFAEPVSIEPRNSKTTYRDVYEVWIHCIAEPTNSSIPVYKLVQDVEEALTEDIVLPEGFDLLLQTCNGMQSMKTDETGERHAIISFEFMVAYGYRIK